MKLTIQIPDEIAETYEARLRPNQTLAQVLAIQLKRFEHVDPRARILIIDGPTSHRIAELTTRLPLTTADDLVKRIADLAELSIGQVRFRFTPAQWRELKHRAERWRMPLGEYAEKVIRQIEAQFFNEVPRELPRMKQPAAPGKKKGAADASTA